MARIFTRNDARIERQLQSDVADAKAFAKSEAKRIKQLHGLHKIALKQGYKEMAQRYAARIAAFEA
tara:strand:- start:331 stop:528 length:198 start_codon:yes stop_codon:yes gene_type:complete